MAFAAAAASSGAGRHRALVEEVMSLHCCLEGINAKIDETNAENGKLAKENELLADYIDSPHTSDR